MYGLSASFMVATSVQQYLQLTATSTSGEAVLKIPFCRIMSFEDLLANPTQISRSVVGAAIATGTIYPHYYGKSVGCLLKEDGKMSLLAIREKIENNRRNFETNPGAIAIDKLRPFLEEPPRTRDLAPLSVETLREDGTIEYYGQFRVWLTNLRISAKKGLFYEVTFNLEEV